MPADEELYGSLLYLEARAKALREPDARKQAAIERVLLWEYLRQKADLHQSRAVTDAREAGAAWAELAPALAVRVASAAYNKALRLRAVALTNPDNPAAAVRRTPEAVLVAERKAAAKAAAERRAEDAATQRYALMAPVARRLLQYRAELDDSDDVDFWLDQIEAVLPHCVTPTQYVSLGIYVEAVARELRKASISSGYVTQISGDAQAAIEAVFALVASG
ncbi:hypothetical protein [Streptomyces sp. NPDC090080]|uniref:hypothetical protein n=1 Tax=Streptomyces sp. NPDC090080 TaxID=3365939 RepID=UPI00382B8278